MRPGAQNDMSNPNSSNSSIAVPRLRDDGANWPDYQSKARTAMGARGLIRHVDGTARKPLPYPEVNGVPMKKPGLEASDEDLEEKEKRLDEYEQKEYGAQHVMLTTVSPRLATLLKSMSASEMWTAIRNDATKKSQLHKVDTRRRLQTMLCDEDTDIKAHLNAMTKLREELEGIGASVPDEDFGTMLLTSLPPSYRSLLHTITHAASLSGFAINPNDLMRIILEEARQRELSENAQKSGDAALNVNKGKGKKGKGNSNSQNKPCATCKRTNHKTEDCFSKGGAKEGQAPWQKKSEKAITAAASTPKRDETEDYLAFTCFGDTPNPAVALAHVKQSHDVILDSGATAHFCPDRSMFCTYTQTAHKPVTAADGRILTSVGRGDVLLQVPNGQGVSKFKLKNVAHAPSMAFTLVSIGKPDDAGCKAEFTDNACLVKDPSGKVLARIPKTNGLYHISSPSTIPDAAHVAIKLQKLTLFEAHRTLGHINYAAVKHAVSAGKITGIEIDDTSDSPFCDACAQAKLHCLPFPEKASNRAKNYGERIHTDVWGPTATTSIGGNRYTVDFVDDATKWDETVPIQKKSQALAAYKKLEAEINTHEDTKIKYLHSDRGGEFNGDLFSEHLSAKGTKRELTVHDTHEQVGVVERWNRTKAELARAMLIDSKLPKHLWGAAMSHAAWIKNRSPTRALDCRTPFHARYGKHPNLFNLVPFGTRAWAKIVDASKIDRRARLGHFVGFDSTSTGYRIYFPDKKLIRVEREVVFNREELTDPVVWTLAEGEMHSSSQRPRITCKNNLDDTPDSDR